MTSEAVLIGRKGSEDEDLIKELIQRVQSVLRAKETKYVVLNVEKIHLPEIIKLLPGGKEPVGSAIGRRRLGSNTHGYPRARFLG